MRATAAFGALGVVLASGAAVACGLSLVGAGPSDEDGEADAGLAVPGDAAREAEIDAEAPRPSEDTGCVAVIVDDALTTIDSLRWLPITEQAGFPTAKDAGTGTSMVALNPTMQASRRSGLWLRDRVPTTAFDVSFDYLVACTSGQYCADGVAAAWVETADAGALDNGYGGKALGIPNLSGGAVAVRLDVKLSDPNLTEDTFPSLVVHAMDAGPSDKTPTKVQRLDTLVGELRRVTLRLRKGQLTVSSSNDAGEAISVVGPTRSGFVGYFGFTAATGAHYDATYVGAFHGEFYDCEPPAP